MQIVFFYTVIHIYGHFRSQMAETEAIILHHAHIVSYICGHVSFVPVFLQTVAETIASCFHLLAGSPVLRLSRLCHLKDAACTTFPYLCILQTRSSPSSLFPYQHQLPLAMPHGFSQLNNYSQHHS